MSGSAMIDFWLLRSAVNCLLVAAVFPDLPLVVLLWLVPLLSGSHDLLYFAFVFCCDLFWSAIRLLALLYLHLGC